MNADSLGSLMGRLLSIVVMIWIYFTPAIMARKRSNRNKVFWVNLLLGWTIVGWLVALVMVWNSKKI